MLRNLQTITGKPVDAMLTAATALVVGMGVQKVNGKATLPTAKTGKDLFFVTKGVSATSYDEIQGALSDYSANRQNIASGEAVVLIKPIIGERYFLDQVVVTGLAVGDYLVAGTDGKFIKAVTSDVTNIKVADINQTDAGHNGIKVEIVDVKTV